jgi:hypothetical protein
MLIIADVGKIEVIDEPTHSFGSVDNLRSYSFEKNLASRSRPTSAHGVLLDGHSLAVFGCDGGATGVNPHSLVSTGGRCYLAIADHVVCFVPKPFEFKWALQTDTAACFGVHYQKDHDALISHGELEISRFSECGKLLWSASGSDIFTEAFFPQCGLRQRDRFQWQALPLQL